MRFDMAVAPSAGTPLWFRMLSALVMVVVLALGAADPAAARLHKAKGESWAPPVSAMVLDPVSGKSLYELDADGPRHPASLTKVMTLYILFEELESGRLTLTSPLTASWKAINQAPSRLGLQKGEAITVEDSIKAIVTKSANDVAMVIAESIGGTDQAFVERMNATALTLGMKRTTFVNPTGLPDQRQITTARDLAILGLAIRDRFPALFSFFTTKSFDYGGRSVLGHNRLLARLAGMDGIKTGFTNASGFNLLASVRRDRQSVIAVVIGGITAKARDDRMADLVERYLPQAEPLAPPPPAPLAFAPAPAPLALPAVTAPQAHAPSPVAPDAAASPPEPETTGSIVSDLARKPAPPRGLLLSLLMATGFGVLVRLHPRLRIVGWVVVEHVWDSAHWARADLAERWQAFRVVRTSAAPRRPPALPASSQGQAIAARDGVPAWPSIM